MEEPDPNPFAEGCPVIIAYNPHFEAGTGVLGRVVKFEAGTGFMGCDLAWVEHTLPLDDTTHVLPFGTANLEPGNAERLIGIAEKHEAEAARLRGLAARE